MFAPSNLFRFQRDNVCLIDLYTIEEAVLDQREQIIAWNRISPVFSSLDKANNWLSDLLDNKITRVTNY